MMKRKILVLGSGAVGLYYGLRILEGELFNDSNTEVKFVLRTDYDIVVSKGVNLKSPDGDITFLPEQLKSKCFRASDLLEDNFDWVLVCFKTCALKEDSDILNFVSRYISVSTKILLIMNGLGVENFFSRSIPATKIYGGMAFICVNRERSYTIEHDRVNDKLIINHIAFGSLLIAHFEDAPDLLLEAKCIWENTKLEGKVSLSNSLLQSRWSKLAWNIPFSGLSFIMGGVTINVIATNPHLRQIADKIMEETILLANLDMRFSHSELVRRGGNTDINEADASDESKIESGYKESLQTTLFSVESMKTTCWAFTDNMGPYKTSLCLDLIAGNELEIEYLFNRPLSRAKEIAGILNQDLNKLYPNLVFLVQQANALQDIIALRRIQGLSVWNATLLN